MLTLSWVLIVLSLCVALAGFARARRAARRLERLSESYWELRYESGQLKSRVTRLETAAGSQSAPHEPESEALHAAATTSFIPLSSLKK